MSNIRRTLIILLILTAILLNGCSSLPRDFERPEPSEAVSPAIHGLLGEFAAASKERIGPDKSGFVLLYRNDESLKWRLALIDSAKYSLDLQTFLWFRDFSGQLLMSRMFQAAERGVRVRLLVDDFLFRNRDRDVAALDEHPNIEIKIWNPGRQRLLGRDLEYLARLRELNHRLHNKVLIADNRVAISGGRNVSDEYFGFSNRYNFFDVGLLTVGPVVPDVSGMFDRYWRAEQAVPGKIFYRNVTVEDLPGVDADRRRALEASPLSEVVPLDPQPWDDLLEKGVAALIPGDVEVIYDKPDERAPSRDAFYGLQRFFRQAEQEILVTSPYLVPGEAFFAEGKKLEERGVQMGIMTNSLGSTDQTIVHAAYARTRIPMLNAGLDVFEMRYEAAMKADLDTPPVESQWVGLHAKAAVIDRKRVFVGSFNLSPRSKDLNTEMGLLVDSPVLGEQLADVLSDAMSPENSWQLFLNEQGNLIWKSSAGTLARQPAQNFRRRVQSRFFGLFPLEQHL